MRTWLTSQKLSTRTRNEDIDMKKINDFEEFLEKLEETLNDIMDEIDIPEKKPVNISVSVNIIPVINANPGDIFMTRKDKTPVDVLETEKNVHVLIGLSGIEPKDIILTCSGKVLEICANNPEITVNELVELPAMVNKTGIKTTYKNGILEVIFNKKKLARKSKNSQQSF
jgi:HSP20 family protein